MKHILRRVIQGSAVTLALASGWFLGTAQLGQAQAPPAAAFEVAIIRPAPPITEIMQQLQSGKAKIGMSVDGARVAIGFSSLADLLRIAYRVKQYQIQGPDWMAQQRFEIEAKIPDGATESQVPEMPQALLADRFKLTIHREKKEQNVYALVVGKTGLKVKESSATPDAPIPDSATTVSVGTEKGQMKMAVDTKSGGMTIQGGGQDGTIRVSTTGGGVHLEMTKTTFASLVDTLTGLVDRPVVDMTELKGNYDLALDLPVEELLVLAQKNAASAGIQLPGALPVAPPNSANAASTPGSSVFQAVEKLGLKLDSRKAPIDTIVVDHLEKNATEN